MGEPAVWRFVGLIDCLEVRDAASLTSVLQTLDDDPQWTVVRLDYELGYLLEPGAAPPGWAPDGRPLARFWRFVEREVLSADAAARWIQENGQGIAGIGGWRPAMDAEAYGRAIEQIQQLIFDGDCYQVNFTFPFVFEWFGAPLALYARLRERQPVRYGGFVGDAQGGVLSLSPELFLARQGERLLARPMKGTAPRSMPAAALRDSVKDRAENLMIVDLLRNDLGRVAENGSVLVDRLFAIEAYPTLWQMVSEVSARVGGRTFGDIIRALFPCGSITGAPKIRAMQIAAELEAVERGVYTGALGWLAPNGDFQLNVAIRTLELAADGHGKLGVGSGIVADSQAAAEWAECLLKSQFLRELDPDLLLIETLRRENGDYPRLAGHLERLQRSASWLGFACDLAEVGSALAEQPAKGLWRVRLTLARDGRIEVGAWPLAAEPEGPRHVELAEARIDARHVLRHHKTSDRAIYDAAQPRLAGDPSLFDLVFLNERGEVAEGSRSNVFVEREGVLLTPPLSSGCLPGVLRAELLATGRAREAVLRPADLADGLWLGNALRGLVRVTLRTG